MQRSRPGKTKVYEVETSEGHCATCATQVKWPRGATEFRCTICQMVNDLPQPQKRPPPRHKDSSPQPAFNRTGTYPGLGPHAKLPPISVERTKGILNKSIDVFIDSFRPLKSPHEILSRPRTSSQTNAPSNGYDLGENTSQSRTVPNFLASSPPVDTNLLHPTSPTNTRAFLSQGMRRPSNSETPVELPVPFQNTVHPVGSGIRRKPVASPTTLPERPLRSPPIPPPENATRNLGVPLETQSLQRSRSSGPNDSDGQRSPPTPFKALEDYILRCFSDHECINSSFVKATSRPRMPPSARSEEDVASRRPGISPTSRPTLPEANISELDAKLLLLGNVAENGSWWTGNEEPVPLLERRATHDTVADGQRNLVQPKSPRINWHEIYEWYSILLNAGTGWKEKLQEQRRSPNKPPRGFEDTEDTLQQMDTIISEGRQRLQRVLLKATENLLKRPGRFIREPKDIRFLLILLANPLLYPKSMTVQYGMLFNTGDPMKPRSRSFNDIAGKPGDGGVLSTSGKDRDQLYGIIKRILGMLSNLSNDCHRHLTAWFSRYDEDRLSELVELVQHFVTRRLKRQHGRHKSNPDDNVIAGLIPNLSGTHADTSAQLHAALGLGTQNKSPPDARSQFPSYMEDWQVRAAAKVMALLFASNKNFHGERSMKSLATDVRRSRPGSLSRTHIKNHGQSLSTSDFYNSMVDLHDLVLDFEVWESMPSRFSFCQYPFFLSVGSKIRIMEHDAKRQMEVRAREAFFTNILRNKSIEQHLVLKVRRECLVDDSLTSISAVVGSSQQDIKKGLRVQFVNEEGLDAGGPRKEWFLLLVREIFDPHHGMFLYDEESQFCYFNPHTFEPSDQYFLVGALLGLAIYNSTILDVALPPFTFKKLLTPGTSHSRSNNHYTLDDLAEYKPGLARGLRQLLEYNGDVQATFCRDFVIEIERYGQITAVPLCNDGANRPVTNSNRAEFVDLYVRYLLDVQVARQFEPFKRGFLTVCGGNALSLFQPEEIELLVRGSDEPLDVPSLKAVAVYENWYEGPEHAAKRVLNPAEQVPLLQWFWIFFERMNAFDQRRLLSFITGSDRIPAVGATNLIIKVMFGGPDYTRFPIARTCFNQLLLFGYRSPKEMEHKVWTAVTESEGFALK